MAQSPKSISVFCGSSYPKSSDAEVYINDIKNLGAILGREKLLVRYGGGLYGHLKDLMESVGQAGGTMEALISPAYFKEDEIYPDYVSVQKLSDDIKRMKGFLKSDAYILTPGGDGTFSEAWLSHNDNLARLFSD